MVSILWVAIAQTDGTFELMTYLLAFVTCLLLSLVATWCVRNIAYARGWIHVPKSGRHVHTVPVPRLGGGAIYFSFMTVVIAGMVIPRLIGSAAPLDAK